MKYLTFDVETTTLNKGNPYSVSNKMCYIGCRTSEGVYKDFKIEYDSDPYGQQLKQFQELIDEHECLVGFNIKFDLHWILRYGLSISDKRIYDTQVSEFILSNQSASYPSLDATAVAYGLEGKIDLVKTDYWDKGIDTTGVPEDLLRDYLKRDVEQTWEVFLKQQDKLEPYKTIISLANQDLLALLEIEKNGMVYDTERSISEGDEIQKQLSEIDSKLVELTGYSDFNPGSGEHISAVLYGGTLSVPCRVATSRTLKDGTIKIGEKWGEKDLEFPRLVEPLPKSELKKDGFFATNEETLKQLKATGKAKQLVKLIQERAKLEKLRGTYLHGIPKLINTMEWSDSTIHGTLNQCVAVTGRLSSTKPNLQNFDGNMGYLFRSRYE